MLLHTCDIINTNEGAVGHVFRASEGVAIKLFRRSEMTEGRDYQASETIVRAIWDSECTAYETLLVVPLERALVSHYVSRVLVAEVLDSNGVSRLDQYVPDCAYEMTLLAGEPLKRDRLSPEQLAFADAIGARWRTHGVTHVIDASHYCGAHGITSIIDFAMQDQLDLLTYSLSLNGTLPCDAIQRWGHPMRPLLP